MTEGVFVKKDLIKPNPLQKLAKKNPKENFIIETENLLAQNQAALLNLPENCIEQLAQKYKVRLPEEYLKERQELLLRMMNCCLEKNAISPSEKDLLLYLAQVLRLSPEDYKATYRTAVSRIIDTCTKPIFESHVYSPEDEEHLLATAKQAGISLKFPPDIQDRLELYKFNWQLLNGPLPCIESDLHLAKGEKLHFKTWASWNEERTVTKRVNYSGFTYSKKIAGNLRWKAGTITPDRIQMQELKQLDEGTLYVTSERIVFVGQHQTKAIAFSHLLDYEPYMDGILIIKDSGKNAFFSFGQSIEQCSIILSRLLDK